MGSQEMVPDMILEILTHTSLTTLDTCKAVSNSWKQLTYDPDFMSVYCERTKNLCGYLIQTSLRHKFVSTIVSINQSGDDCKIKICPEDGKIKLLATCNQGICCYERVAYKNNRYFACKPTTQQWEPLPNPKLKYQTAGVGITVLRSTPSLRYKIVRLSSLPYGRATQYSCEIFDSENWGWRWRRGVTLSCYHYEFIDKSHPAVSIGESLHWLTNENNVLKFDASEESFNKFSLPPEVNNSNCRCERLFECEGNLGFSCIFDDEKEETIKLWVLQQGNEWARGTTDLDIASLENVDFSTHVGFYTRQVPFIKTLYRAFFYRLDQQLLITQVDLDYNFTHYDQVFQFRSDLHKVNLRGNRKNNSGNVL